MLFDADICDMIAGKHILIAPFDLSRLGPNSYDLTLGAKFLRKEGPGRWVPHTAKGMYTLAPDEFVLGHTNERTLCSPHVIPTLEGVSTVAREGVSVHLSAGVGDAGFAGQWTLEIKNHTPHPVDLYVRQKIAQVLFEVPGKTDTLGCARPYYLGGHCYTDQEGPVPPGMRSKQPYGEAWHKGTQRLQGILARAPHFKIDERGFDETYVELYKKYEEYL